jgi:hypothetical protein
MRCSVVVVVVVVVVLRNTPQNELTAYKSQRKSEVQKKEKEVGGRWAAVHWR